MVPAEKNLCGPDHPLPGGSAADAASARLQLWTPSAVEQQQGGPAAPQVLRDIATDYGPDLDLPRLLARLNRNVGFVQSVADPAELRGSMNPLAALNGYKHRLQAARAARVAAQLRLEQVEDRLRQTEDRLQEALRWLHETEDRLRQTVALWQAEVSAIRLSRGWKLVQAARGVRLSLSAAWKAVMAVLSRRPSTGDAGGG
jgi:hypothetical protein